MKKFLPLVLMVLVGCGEAAPVQTLGDIDYENLGDLDYESLSDVVDVEDLSDAIQNEVEKAIIEELGDVDVEELGGYARPTTPQEVETLGDVDYESLSDIQKMALESADINIDEEEIIRQAIINAEQNMKDAGIDIYETGGNLDMLPVDINDLNIQYQQ